VKKLLVVCVGGINKYNGIGTEDFTENVVSVATELKSAIQKKVTLRDVGLETQQLDEVGIGTGLNNVVFDDTVEIKEVNDVTEAAEVIKNDVNEDRERAVVLGNNLHMSLNNQKQLEEIESTGTAVYSPIEVPTIAEELIEYSRVVAE
jgi:hypothetical protein